MNTLLPFSRSALFFFMKLNKFNKYATQNFSSTISPVFDNSGSLLYFIRSQCESPSSTFYFHYTFFVRDQSSFLPRHPNSRLLFHREMSETTHPRPQVFSVSGSIIWQFCCMIDVISSILHNSPKVGQQQLVMINY